MIARNGRGVNQLFLERDLGQRQPDQSIVQRRESIVLESRDEAHTRADRSRSAFAMTETELKLIAAAAIIGLSRMPKNG